MKVSEAINILAGLQRAHGDLDLYCESKGEYDCLRVLSINQEEIALKDKQPRRLRVKIKEVIMLNTSTPEEHDAMDIPSDVPGASDTGPVDNTQ
jgi:hypothetical protein